MVAVSANNTGSPGTITASSGSYYTVVPAVNTSEMIGFWSGGQLLDSSNTFSMVAEKNMISLFPADIWDFSRVFPNFYS